MTCMETKVEQHAALGPDLEQQQDVNKSCHDTDPK